MATPPKVGHQERSALISRITQRRHKVEDLTVELLPDPEQADPRDVLDYLHKHPSSTRWARKADHVDALTLIAAMWWADRRREYRVLTGALKDKLFLSQLGAPLGIESRAGVRDRIDRLAALLEYDRPDEKLTREARRIAAQQDHERGAREAFVAEHRDELNALTTGLLDAADRYGVGEDERDWLDELRYDHEHDSFTPASLAVLNLATNEVATAPAVLELETTHNVHRLLRRADQLRTAFANLTSR